MMSLTEWMRVAVIAIAVWIVIAEVVRWLW